MNQGFVNKDSNTRSQCNSPNCVVITIPKRERKGIDRLAEGEFVSTTARMLADPGDPLGPYLCSSCYHFQREHDGNLPDEAFCNHHRQVRYYQQWVDNQRKLKQPIHCSGKDCNKVELPTPTRHTMFRMNTSNPSQFLCEPCWNKAHPRRPRRPRHTDSGGVCRNPYCGARPGNRTVTGKTVKDIVSGLCYPCVNYKVAKLNGAEKTEKANMVDEDIYDKKISRQTMNQIKIDILTGRVKHHCSSCGIEVKKLSWERHANRNEGKSPSMLFPINGWLTHTVFSYVLNARRRTIQNFLPFRLFSLTSGQKARS